MLTQANAIIIVVCSNRLIMFGIENKQETSQVVPYKDRKVYLCILR